MAWMRARAWRVEAPPLSTKRVITLVWMTVGLLPFMLQIRGYTQFMTPHKISLHLVTPTDIVPSTGDLLQRCPVKELYMAGAWWNISPIHYFHVEKGLLCHYVMPQYNVHGSYFLGFNKAEPYKPHQPTAPTTATPSKATSTTAASDITPSTSRARAPSARSTAQPTTSSKPSAPSTSTDPASPTTREMVFTGNHTGTESPARCGSRTASG